MGETRRGGHVVVILEISFVIACVLVAEWAVLPFFGRNLLVGSIPVACAFVFMFISHRARGETARELGWRVDNLLRALRLLLPPMLAATLALVLIGRLLGGSGLWKLRGGGAPAFWLVVSLYVWGLMQQYALQAFINRRAQLIWGRGPASILFVACVFGLLHLPNLWLTLATFAGGLLWAYAYQRTPNLLALALSHCLMTIVLVAAVPPSLLHGLRVGYGYFR